MTQQYDNTNSGALFRNEKRRSDNSPTHTGQLTVLVPSTGELLEVWVSAWVKESRAGQKYFSLAVTPKEESGNSRSSVPEKSKENLDDFDDDIPF